MKFIKPFRGAPKGAAFPRDYRARDECPAELARAARAAGAIAPDTKTKTVPKVRNKAEKAATKIQGED